MPPPIRPEDVPPPDLSQLEDADPGEPPPPALTAAPEIRIDQLTGLRVVLAPGRAERPDAFSRAVAESKPDAAEKCPFCEGREDRTPPEVWADRPGGGEADTPGWRVRSVPNLYPVLGGPERRWQGKPRIAREFLPSAWRRWPLQPVDPMATAAEPLRRRSRPAARMR